MKIKNTLFLVASMIVTQSAVAARLTVYNETPYVQDINIYAGSNWQKAHRIEPKEKVSINAGVNAFTHISWRQPKNVNSNSPVYSIKYQALIPSSVTMLTGSFMLWDNGKYGINFDKNGASDDNLVARYGTKSK